jgi:hypothetical protein
MEESTLQRKSPRNALVSHCCFYALVSFLSFGQEQSEKKRATDICCSLDIVLEESGRAAGETNSVGRVEEEIELAQFLLSFTFPLS